MPAMGLKPVKKQQQCKTKTTDGKGRHTSSQSKHRHRPHRQHHHHQQQHPEQRKEFNFPSISLKTQLDYARNGHTVLRNFIDPTLLATMEQDAVQYMSTKELQAWRQKVEVASDSAELAASCRSAQDCQSTLQRLGIYDSLPFLQFFNAWRDVQSIRELCFALGETAATLLDVPSVRLYQDSLFLKRSGDGPTPWHLDARMAPFDTSHMVTLWIPFHTVDETGLLFVPKSHNDFALPYWNSLDGTEYTRLEERYRHKVKHHMPLQLGDATVHSGWTLHCADGNTSSKDRMAIAVSFVDSAAEIRQEAIGTSIDGTEAVEGNGKGYGDNEDKWSYQDWVRDVPTRQPFDHPMVPIVWPRQD